MRTKIRSSFVLSILALSILNTSGRLNAQITYELIPAGSFVINMGVTPQSVGNALKPYGMIYDLIYNYGVPVKWIIDPNKGKDEIDFSHDGVDYRGGPFIIPGNYRTTEVNARITYWTGQGVVGNNSITPLSLPVFKTLKISSAPRWTLDKQSGKIALSFFANAGIPPAAYGGDNENNWKNPNDLDCCDDIFVMPHADPKWATHAWIKTWNLDCKGSIWLGCHSGSALENMYNPANTAEQTNFLSEKVTTGVNIINPVPGSTAYAQNSLILWGNHSNGTPPYSYSHPQDPIMQFLGTLDLAVQNGSEQIYIPVNGTGSGWRSTTVTAVYDPDHSQIASSEEKHRAAIIAYGRAYGESARGYVMMQAAHDISKNGALNNRVAAQRTFFNFSFLAAKDKAPDPEIDINVANVYSGETATISFTITPLRNIAEFSTIEWTSSCPGAIFTPNNSQTTLFTAPVVSTNTNCLITVMLIDTCGRTYKSATSTIVFCDLQVTTALTNPCFDQPSGGSIAMSITNGTPPYAWTWSRTSPAGGPVSGSGTTIPNLSAGTYSVTVTDNAGAGCAATFTVPLTLSPEIIISATPVPPVCPGGSNGGINVSVSGGIPGYTYLWGDGPTTANRSGLTAGTYYLTVTDSKGCKNTTTVEVSQPAPIVITPSVTDVSCFGFNNGQISLDVNGGTPGYTYLWNDGNSSQIHTGLAPGTYSVTVTDANSCTQTLGGLEITQPLSGLNIGYAKEDVKCFGATTGPKAGTITLNVSGGTPDYSYVWTKTGTPGIYATSKDLSDLAAGTYNVSVIDARSCIATLSVTITQPLALSLNVLKKDPTCPPTPPPTPPDPPATPPVNADGEIDLSVTGGVGPYSYAWTTIDGSIPAGQEDDEDLSDLISGTYTVVVSDANGCTATISVTLNYLIPNPVQPGGINH